MSLSLTPNVSVVARVINVTAATTLTQAQSGQLITFGNAAAYTITLPPTASSAGVSYEIAQGTATAAFTVNVHADGAVIVGLIARAGAAALTAAPSTNVNFLTGASVIGDHVHLVCNGNSWLALGATAAGAGMSFT